MYPSWRPMPLCQQDVQEASQVDHMNPNPNDPIDRAVLEFQQGIQREQNFERIVKRFYFPVRAFLAARCPSTEEHLELNQETFLKVYTGLDGFAWKASFSSWLFTIAVNVYRNWRSGNDRQERGASGGPVVNDMSTAAWQEQEPVMIDVSASSLDGLLSEEQNRLLREAVDGLPSKMRRCVELRLHDLDYQEIADEMQLSIGTVKAHLHAAREKLRCRLSHYFDGIDF